jgi:non-specific serine/threonine protein kinase
MPGKSSNLGQFWQELKRRKVIHVIVVYATAAFVLIELVNNVYETLRLPPWTPFVLLLILAIGLPVVIAFSWFYGITFFGEKSAHQDGTSSEPFLSEIVSHRQEKSIIVLPFENISPDSDQEYFSDGLSEEIITDLSHIHDLLVISRNSAWTFKGSSKTTKEIAEKVNVRYVLEGSVRKSANNLRITAQLIDANNDSHIWAEKYSGTLDDVFDIQEKVSHSIVSSLRLKLSPKESHEIDKRPFDNVYAYDCYLKANQEIYQFSKDSLDRAVHLIQNGLDIVGQNELLYEAMGNAHIQYVNFGVSSDEMYLRKAEEWIEKLFTLNPNSSQGYFLDGLIRWKRGDWEEGVRRLQKSLALDPNNPRPREYLVYITSVAGKIHVSSMLLPKLLDIDPLTPLFQCFPGWIEYMEGNFKGALKFMQKMYHMDPENPLYGILYANFLTRIQQFEEAYSIIDKVAKKAPETNLVYLGLFRKYALIGEEKEALKMATPKFQDAMRWDEQFSWEMAANFSLIGHKQKALDWLENAVTRGFINYPFLKDYDPLLQNIRGEERFIKLMERVKYEWENFKV